MSSRRKPKLAVPVACSWAILLVMVEPTASEQGQVNTAPPTAERKDLFGDRLPAGALARLGTTRPAAELPQNFEPPSSVHGVVFSPDGRLLASYGEPSNPAAGRAILVWEAETGRQLAALKGHSRLIRAVALSPDGKHLVSSSFDSSQTGSTRIWNIATGQTIFTIPEGGTKIRFSADGARVAVAVRDQIRVYNVATGREVQRFLGRNIALSFSADSRKLLSVSSAQDAVVRLFDFTTGKVLLKLEGCRSKPAAAVISPDGRTIAAADGNDILLWEVTSGEPLHRLKGHQKKVFSLAISSDSRFLASAGGFDKTARLWELATGKQVRRIADHDGLVTAVAFSELGNRLVTGSTDRTALVWNVSATARSLLPREVLDEKSLETIWHNLADATPAKAYRAVGRVAASGNPAVAYLKQRVEAILIPAQNKRIEQLIRELDHEQFVVRNRATAELIKLRQIAKPILLKVLKETSSAEVRYRIRRILSGSENSPRFSAADVRRMHRIIHAVEQSGGEDGPAILEMIVKQFPTQTVVRDARETLDRLRQRRAF